ncbi:hypothetical protein ACQPW1_02110 [Nocardia sp. CA-128927]|uniref:hypothetical protein n=1 Tax=Nocardia sp. CA-128927 TaxID=3239975 RepID=UPI003D990542
MTAPSPRLPEPALVRSVLVTLTAVAAYLLNRQVDTSWVEPLLTLYTLIAPLIAGLLIRRAVRPVKSAEPPRPARDQ